MTHVNSFKPVIFRIIAFLPLFVLILILINFTHNTFKLNFFDYEKTYYNIESRIEWNDENNKISIKDGKVEFYNINSAGFSPPGKKAFNFSDSSKLIFVYGGSSVVAPKYEEVFARFLELELNENFTVINFGMDAVSSHAIKMRIDSTLKNEIKPELIVVYSGHNDYSNVYMDEINEKIAIFKKTFLVNLFQDYIERLKFKHYEFTEEFENFGYVPTLPAVDFVIEPKLKKYLQRIGFISFDNNQFERYNDLILKRYSKNLYDIIALTQSHNIPLIIITPISNLKAEPFGVNKFTWDIYKRGLKEKDYNKRINLLREAKDNEIFSGAIRAKSELNEFLRNVNETNVYVLDLERELIGKNFSFSYNDFYDYVHMRTETHKIMANMLYDFITESNLLQK